MSFKVLHLSTYARNGGAARAAQALHRAMLKEGINSTMWTAHGNRFTVARTLDRQLWRLQRSPTNTWRSPARFGCLSAKTINESDADVVNVHWITDGFLTIEQIARIEKPIVWSLYDMWAFCGTEHYGVDTPDARWRTGYTPENRPANESGIDIDRNAWLRKDRLWRPGHVVPASTWLAESVRASALMGQWPMTRIPHVADTHTFAPVNRADARRAMGIPDDRPTILFLASAGIGDPRKGFDLLELALPAVQDRHRDVQVLVAGPIHENYISPSRVDVRFLGQLAGDEALSFAYGAADVLAVPSREDNMPLTAIEAQACGRAVVSFRIGGLPDIVEDRVTGALAPEGDIDALAVGLIEALADARGRDTWGRAARIRAENTWSGQVVVNEYLEVFEQAMP